MQVKIAIEDINDNHPVFLPGKYRKNINYDEAIGATILNIKVRFFVYCLIRTKLCFCFRRAYNCICGHTALFSVLLKEWQKMQKPQKYPLK